MLSDMFYKLWQSGTLTLGIWETVYMTLISTVIAYVIGLPLGIVLWVTDRGGLHPVRWLNSVLGFIVNVFRSIPFIILMVAMLPAAKAIVGTSMGNKAMIVTLIIAAAPYVARMVESSVKEVDSGVIEAAQSMGATTGQIVWKVLLPEAMPGIVAGLTISFVSLTGYSAMAGAVGGGGLGDLGIRYGYQRFLPDVMLAVVVILIVFVQAIQSLGDWVVRRMSHR